MTLVLGAATAHVYNDVFNILDYGAVADYPTTDNTAAIQRAVNALRANGSGVLFVPPGLYKVASALDLKGLNECRVVGRSGKVNANTNPLTMLIYTGGGSGIAIDLADSNGLVWDGVSVWAGLNAFNGVLMNFDPTVSGLASEHDIFGNRIQNCQFRSPLGTTATLLSLATSIEVSCDNVSFGDAGASGTQVRMVNTAAAGHWSNANSFRSCSFLGVRATSIQDPGPQTTLIDCTFEPTTGNVPAPIRYSNLGNEAASCLTVLGCGFWDNTGTGGAWIVSTVATDAFVFSGCKCQVGPGGVFFNLSAHNGLALNGCRFDAPNGGTPNIFTPAQNITNGSMVGCHVVSPVVDNHTSVFV